MFIASDHGWSGNILALPAEPWLYHQKMEQLFLEGSKDHNQIIIDRVIYDNHSVFIKLVSSVQDVKNELILFSGYNVFENQKWKKRVGSMILTNKHLLQPTPSTTFF